MWARHESRTRHKPFLQHVVTSETKWVSSDAGPVAHAYGLLASTTHDTPPPCETRHNHNMWKRGLICRHVQPGAAVADLMCNRGGDLLKYMHASVATYLGVDISPLCVAEAARRASKCTTGMRTTFAVADLGIERIPCDGAIIDVAACMFGLHYLADDVARMSSFLGEVARILKVGGTFVAIVPNHESVRERLAAGDDGGGEKQYVLRGHPIPCDADLAERPWGHQYLFQFVGRTPLLPEYAVYPHALEDLAGQHGLQLRSACPGPGRNSMYLELVFTRVHSGDL